MNHREIKFRAWNVRDSRMFYNVQNSYMGKARSADATEFEASYACSFGEALLMPQVFHVMQFTGLLDKDGREIFEGDIVTNIWARKFGVLHPSNVHIVEFYNGGFKPLYRDKYSDGIVVESRYELLDKNIEVIGNIYEHPEKIEQYEKMIRL